MALHMTPAHALRRHITLATSDSLVRNSLFLMASTVVTAALGYIFWIITAHMFTSAQVGIASAVISLCSTVALLTYLGSWATLIERLHVYEQSTKWTAILVRICLVTAGITAIATAAAVPMLAHSKSYGIFFGTLPPMAVAVAGSAAWTLVNLFSAAFIAARRADGLLSIQTLVSVTKLLLVVPMAAAGVGATGIVGAWVASSLLGVVVGAIWLLPRLGLGRRPSGLTAHRTTTGQSHRRSHQRARHRKSSRTSMSRMKRLIGQHLTSAGGAITPLVLPVLVVLRLGVTLNAYFYITWMIGGVFFMVSPSVAAALFAESVRANTNLRHIVAKAIRIISLILLPAMVVMIAGGRIILGIFGTSYATAGYGLLILLAISAIPDAISNIAVAVFRVTNWLGYSAALNISILITTLAGAWFLMPRLGIAGVGVAWLGAQTFGAIASLPAYTLLGRRVTA
jgi:O-antigen/teichoic acid export membrane protein